MFFFFVLLKEIGGCGVDVVFNFLVGEFLYVFWKCVVKFGIFVEIGCCDFVG